MAFCGEEVEWAGEARLFAFVQSEDDLGRTAFESVHREPHKYVRALMGKNSLIRIF